MVDQGQGHRHQRLTQLILEELESLLATEVSDPRLQTIRVTEVVLSVDYRNARVHFVTTSADEEPRAELDKIDRAFVKAAPFIRKRVGDALDLKRVPEFRFVYDREAAAQVRAKHVLDKS